ncbi:polyprenyl synthetase family protein [Limosilactobacillus sp. STM2_1]|uniref:Polyprenyl synthetase family protein n=1 Tax=Limosilactobacillus rudii TaxID=2759755 RepID=A0A7W3UJQ5_9LACO|nr:polyprenyl synthetase family protein [Limosilactobacillus rudii]MBB1080264.1 polyprenyl synthetase family protein [Limosilactobacillus rudii]MBB1096832.1 polyprenyl synthetase family protein [Limosilactobacillus rudii]MCD7133729.1 polyprenyl synthetase family protein [Limosilactobacillus rudii]
MKQHFFHAYPAIDRALNEVNQIINSRITINNSSLNNALQQMASNGGKYLRPAFFLLFADINNKQSEERNQLIKIAASLEILHMATLIHDDIIDDSPKRRGAVSIQSAFGKDTAVYSGDFLFTIFFSLLVETMRTTPYLARNAQTMRKILTGELGQMANRFDLNQSLLDYYRNVNGKTAALFSLAAEEGAYFGQTSRRTTALAKRIGQNIGISFQILDDILDYSGDKHLNKPVLEDLATGVYSLPLLLTLQNHRDELQPLLDKRRQMTIADMEKVQRLVIQYGGVQEAQQIAEKFTKKAHEEIQALPNSKSKRLLAKLAQKLLTRVN